MSVHTITDEAQASYQHCEDLYSAWRRHIHAGHRIRAVFAGWRSQWAKMAHEDRFGPLDD